METTSLDEDLVSDFETGDKLYNRFYKAVPGELTCSFIYINNNSIIFIKKVSTKLEKGILEKTELIKLLKENTIYENNKYTPCSIFKWNLDIAPEDISKYTKDDANYPFLTKVPKIDDIHFADTILFFHNENSLYFIMNDNIQKFKNRTKKIYINKEKLKHRKSSKKRLKASAPNII
tara:strand:+ start:17656 stop:18186 length:531 start_codon:yes stop_codon:yes gene_type:complete